MKDRKFGLLGKKMGHSHSPLIYDIFGISDYGLFEKTAEEIDDFVKNTDLDGFNVTMPYKKDVFYMCDVLSETAKRLGNVNTLVKREGKVYGYNTDYYGFDYLLKEFNITLKDKKVLILGTGGAAATVHIVAEDQGASQIIHLSRTGPRDWEYLSDSYDNLDQYADFDVLINASPVGMFPDSSSQPVNLDIFSNLTAVIDLIYNPLRSKLVLDARSRNIKAIGGLLMLVAQAKKSAELYLDKEIPDHEICTAYNKLLHRIENVVFVGMPGSGKTTIGIEIAHFMDRQLVDIDHYIQMTTSMHPAEWIISKGEKAFREVETQALQKIASMSGVVITPGGGGILSAQNRLALRQNSRVYWLTRPLAKLDRAGRPLSSDLEALYEARRALYESVSDYAIANETDPEIVAQKITEEFHQKRGPICL